MAFLVSRSELGRAGQRRPDAAARPGRVPDPLGRETENAVRWALEAGYRHVDTAKLYGNEQSVGRALAAGGVPREELFVTTKLLPRARDARRALEDSLRLLDLDPVDLYLIHWPTGEAERAVGGARGRLRGRPGARDRREQLGRRGAGPDGGARAHRAARQPGRVLAVRVPPCAAGRVPAARRRVRVLQPADPRARGCVTRPSPGIAGELGRTPAQVILRWALERECP